MDQRTARRQPAPRLRTNLDTDFLKLIAILSMLLDHIGAVFFPEHPAFRWVGRLAFPIFCYCMTVGLLYTRDIKRYLGRLGLFALISQPCYILATHPWDWQTEWMNWNIFFTLFLSLLAMWGFQMRRWWLFAAAFLCVSLFNFDYSGNGILLMLIFFLCRERPGLGAGLYILFWLPALWSGSPEDPRALLAAGHAVDWTAFALLAAPFIVLPARTGIRVPKWFFYAFYPAHLLTIGVIRLAAGI